MAELLDHFIERHQNSFIEQLLNSFGMAAQEREHIMSRSLACKLTIMRLNTILNSAD